jgi:hypothetical protein
VRLILILALVLVALLALPLPGPVALLLLVSSPYWLAPVVIGTTQRMRIHPPTVVLQPGETTLPHGHDLLEHLSARFVAAGFEELGRLALAPGDRRGAVAMVLLQHPRTTDIAHVTVTVVPAAPAPAATVSIIRDRTNGGRLQTAGGLGSSPFPRHPADDVLRIRGRPDVDTLWRLHQLRVGRDRLAAENEMITDPLRFQRDLEEEVKTRLLASGEWRLADEGESLRPTPLGAVRIAWRMLPPWSLWTAATHRRRRRELEAAAS